MTSPIDIRPDHLGIVRGVLQDHLPADVKVWVFGSRAQWSAREASDLDLALEGGAEIDRKMLDAVADAFEDSDLPYAVDIVDLNRVTERFRQIVQSHKVRLPIPIGHDSDRCQDDEWRQVTLGHVCSKIGSGATPRGGKEVYLDEGPYALIRSQNVYNEGFRHGGLAFIGDNHADQLRNVEVERDDVLVNITGDSVARVCQVDTDVLPARVNQHVAILRTDPELLHPGYLRYYLTSPQMQSMLLSWAGSGGTRNALTKGMLESLQIPLPPLTQQRLIARILGTLDDKIELNRRMNETLEQMARTLFKSWFVDFDPVRAKMDGRWQLGESLPGLPADMYELFPDRLIASELGEIPDGWQVKPLEDCIDLAYGKSLKADVRNPGNVPVFGSNGPVGWHDQRLVEGPGIVVGRKGNPGTVSWCQSDFFPIDTTFYVVPKSGHLNLHFLFYALTGQGLPAIAADSAVPGLNRNLAYMNQQLVPDETVVEHFGGIASAIFTRRHQLDEESRAVATQRDTLLPELVSGKILPRNK